ncbi:MULTISPECIES: ABC transporter permease [unclassified Myroides]|uniref:ABC transporter permease n=1 Tax=unclassified Myroides TaxID=2642485 RepID=UPI003D2F78C0
MLNNWFKIYRNNRKKNKVYFLLTLVCLAVGMTAVLLSALYVKEAYSFDQWNDRKEEIFFVESKGEVYSSGSQPFVLGSLLKERHPFVEDILWYNGYTDEEVTYQKKTYFFDKVIQSNESFFRFFPYSFVYGSPTSVFNNPNEIALEKEKAVLLFGENNPIGEQLTVDEEVYTVVGVYDLGKTRSSFMPEAVINDFQVVEADLLTSWSHSRAALLVMTKERDALTDAIDKLYTQEYLLPLAKKDQVGLDEFHEKTKGLYRQRTVVHALPDLHFDLSKAINSPESSISKQFILVLVGLSSVLLILSIFNYVNLSLSQAPSRAKEVGVRKALGASKFDIVKQMVMETSWTLILVLLISVVLVLWMLPFVNSFLHSNITIQLHEIVGILLVVYVVVLLLSGIIPALYLANYRVLRILKGNYTRSRQGGVLKNAFLIVQFAIACGFSMAAYVIFEQVKFMTNKDLGFNGNQVIQVPFLSRNYEDDKYRVYQTFKQEALKIKGIEQIGITDLDFGSKEGIGYNIALNYEGKNLVIGVSNVEEGYLEMMEIGLVQGRYLNQAIANDSIQNALVNQKLFELLKKDGLEGWTLNNKQIVGVIQDFHFNGLDRAIRPMLFMLPSEEYTNFNTVSVKVDVGQLETLLPLLEELWITFNPESHSPFDYQFVNQQFARSFEQVQLQKKVMVGLSYLVLFIAFFGLFAVSSFSIGTRLKEVAIRKIVGADTTSLIRKLSYQYLIYCGIGFGLSVLPSYYVLNLWLNEYAYHIEIGYEVYVVCLALMVLLTLAIVVSRAYKATKVNVLEYIKYE